MTEEPSTQTPEENRPGSGQGPRRPKRRLAVLLLAVLLIAAILVALWAGTRPLPPGGGAVIVQVTVRNAQGAAGENVYWYAYVEGEIGAYGVFGYQESYSFSVTRQIAAPCHDFVVRADVATPTGPLIRDTETVRGCVGQTVDITVDV